VPLTVVPDHTFLVHLGAFLQQRPSSHILGFCGLPGRVLWSFNTPLVATASSRRGAAQDLDLPEPVTWALRALDFGTGSERGQRSEDTSWQSQLSAYEEAAEALAKAKIQQRKKDQAESDDVRAPAKGS